MLVFVTLFGCGKQEKNLNNKKDVFSYNPLIANNSSLNNNEMFYKENLIKFVFSDDKKTIVEEQIINKRQGELNYKARKLSTELFLRNKGIKGKEKEEAIEELKNEQIFFFEFEEQTKKNILTTFFEDTETPIKYLSFKIINDFKLVNDKGDTLTAIYSNYENSSHIVPFERLIISFPKPNNDSDYTLIYKDKLFTNDIIKFSFPSDKEIQNNFNKIL